MSNRRQLYDKINMLSTMEHEEIFKLIQNKVKVSTNKNGLFFNLADLNEETFKSLEDLVAYCLNNKQSLDDYDQKINECKQNYITTMHINLNFMPKEETVLWEELIPDEKSKKQINGFISNLSKRAGDITSTRRTTTTIFNMAKKKFSKPFSIDQQFETNIFEKEEYCM